MAINLSIAVYALSMCVLILLSVDEILLLKYMNWSTNFISWDGTIYVYVILKIMVNMYDCVCVCIYIYIYTHTIIYIYSIIYLDQGITWFVSFLLDTSYINYQSSLEYYTFSICSIEFQGLNPYFSISKNVWIRHFQMLMREWMIVVIKP